MNRRLSKRASSRLLAWVLAVCMALTMLPGLALAEGNGEARTVAGFDELPAETREQTVTAGTALNALHLPDALQATVYAVTPDTQQAAQIETATIKGVSWESDPAYDGQTPDTYTFTAILPDGYSTAEGVSLPQITVTMGETANVDEEAVARVETLIAALPTAAEYSALVSNHPDHEDENYDEKYADWLAALNAAKKAIGEAVNARNALSGAEKDRIAPELSEKLDALIAVLQAGMLRDSGDNAITIKVNGGSPVGGDSLQAALRAANVEAASITSIEITAGTVTNDDWTYLLYTKKDAFAGLKTFVVDDAVTSVAELYWDFLPNIETVRIPHLQEINTGYDRVFDNCTALKSVSLPNTATIGQQAFMNCTSLETITLPRAVTVGSQAFSGCSSLKTVVLPKVQTLYFNAFENASSVTSLSLPATPPGIGGTSYNIFTGLTGETPILHFVDGDGNALAGEALTKAEQAYLAAQDSSTDDMYWHGLLVRFAITLTFTDGDNVEHSNVQGGSLFKALYAALDNDDSKLLGITSIKITGGKVTAADWNFLLGKRSDETSCKPPNALKELVITEDVMTVDAVTTYLPSTLEKIDMAKITKLPECGNSTALKTVRLPDLLTVSSFADCPNLTTVILPKVTTISERAFGGCPKLTELTLPAAPPTCRGTAFYPPETGQKLTLVGEDGETLAGEALQTALRAYKEAPDGYTGDFKWEGWHLLIENITVTFGTSGGDQDPVCAATLEQAIAIAGLQGGDITKVIVTAGELTTSDWHRLSGQEMPSLETLEIKDTVRSVQEMPYYTLRKPFSNTLESVSVAKLEILPLEAFKGLPNLKTAVFPDLKTMESQAFIGCTALKSVNCPKLTEVPYEAFSGCTSLTDATFDAATEIRSNALNGCTSLAAINAPKAKSIGDYAFQYCAFTALTLPAAETIGGYAFRGNAALQTLSLPRATEIGEHAFLDCDKLETLKLPAAPPSGTSWAPDKPNGSITFVDENGNPLSDVSAAQAAYMAADDGNTQDGMWRGWKVKDTMTATVKTTENAAGVTVTGGSLKNMLYSISVGTITSLEITGGNVTADDWTLLQKGKKLFTSLENLTVTDTVGSVANIPAGKDKDEVIIDPSINPWDKNDLGNNTARSLPRILTDDPPIVYTSTMPETLKTVSIAKVTYIGHDAFKNCTKLTSAVFPAVTEIGEHAFIGCTSLASLSVPAAAPTVGAEAFSDCAADRTVRFVAADGTGLTLAALDQARSNYAAAGANDGVPDDGLWHGWKIQDSDRADISAKLAVTLAGWTYGETANTPAVTLDGTSVTDHLTFSYTGTDSAVVPTKAGTYTVTARYADETQTGTATADFTIASAPLTITGGTVITKAYDGNTDAKVTAVTFDGLQNGETLTLDTDYAVTDAAFADAAIGQNKAVTATVVLKNTDKAKNYTLLSGALTATGNIAAADGKLNPAYLRTLEELHAVHIVTNVTPTLADVKLPEGWRFTGDTAARLIAREENGGKQSFAVQYTSDDSNYGDVRLDGDDALFPVSTVVLEMDGGLDMQTIDGVGQSLRFSQANLKVTGAALPDTGDYAITNMEWSSSAPKVATVAGEVSSGQMSATVTSHAKGLTMVGVAYKNGGGMFGYVLVQVTAAGVDSGNSVDDLKDITDTLEELIDPESPSETDKKAVDAVADELTRLPDEAKQALTVEDVKALDELKTTVGQNITDADKRLTVTIDTTPAEQTTAPESVEVVGAAIASGADSGAVKVYVTPVQPTAGDAKLELNLKLEVNSTEKQLASPLFFTMELPASVDVARLTIKHLKSDGSSETVPFTHEGQVVSFKLSSFSGLQFLVGSSSSRTTRYTITATAGAGGSITPSGQVGVARNSDKTFIITAKDGYEIADVLVDGKSVGAVGSYTFEKVDKTHTIEARFQQMDGAADGNPFRDVSTSDWFYDSVQYVYEQGLMNGTGETTFSPQVSTSRGMIVTILWRMEGQPESGAAMPFADVKAGSYCHEAVAWAAANGIVKGYSAAAFGPDDGITREQLAAILYRYAQHKGYDVSVGEDTNMLSYTDFDQISSYAIPALQWACGAGILNGKDGGRLDPTGSATRAETAAVLERFIRAAK